MPSVAMEKLARQHMTERGDLLLGVGFAHSRSCNFALAVGLAQQASIFVESDHVYWAGFGRDLRQVELALTLIRMVEQWKSAVLWINGRRRRLWPALDVLYCYRIALSCRNHRAHCYQVEDAPSFLAREHGGQHLSGKAELMPRRVLFPCRLLRSYFRYQPEHPESVSAQMEALAIARDYDWCPYLDVDAFEVL
ncbi:hypothetical protein ACR2R6_12905 [Methylocaldum gracile subsp. desertum]|uniref:hypothetical protein n=1 Tax=Methylocaldum sp. GT1BW TaxID=3438964 RepID=UPI003DA15D03